MRRPTVRLGDVLVGPLLVVLATSPSLFAQTESDDISTLGVWLGTLGGGSLFDVDPALAGGGQRGLVAGVRAGLHATRPPFVRGGARFGLLPSLAVRYEPSAQRVSWSGSAALTMTLGRLVLLMGIGYGLTSTAGAPPKPMLDITCAIDFRLGGWWFGVTLDTLMRLADAGRSLQLLGTVGWEFELQRLPFN